MKRLTSRAPAYYVFNGLLALLVILDVLAYAYRPSAGLAFFAFFFLILLIRRPAIGVFADAERVRVRNSTISLTVPWSAVEGFTTRRSQAFSARRVTEVLWIDLVNGERYPMVGVWRREEAGLMNPVLVSATGATQLLSELEERHQAARGEIAVG